MSPDHLVCDWYEALLEASLSGGRLRHIQVVEPNEADARFFKHSGQAFDLIIFGEPNQTFGRHDPGANVGRGRAGL